MWPPPSAAHDAFLPLRDLHRRSPSPRFVLPVAHDVARLIRLGETGTFAAPVKRSVLGPPPSPANTRCWALYPKPSRSCPAIFRCDARKTRCPASAVPAAYCELACTESCERVSSLTPVGEDILLALVYSTEKFPAKLIQNCKLRRWIFSLFNLGQFPASLANQSPIPQFQAWSSSICLPPANAWFQLIVLYSQLNPSRQPPLGSS